MLGERGAVFIEVTIFSYIVIEKGYRTLRDANRRYSEFKGLVIIQKAINSLLYF